MDTPAIVVAVDGTDPSMTAVRWAALEAQRSNRNLHIIHILDWDWAVARYDFSGRQFDLARQLAEGLTTRAAHDARATAPAIEVTAPEGDAHGHAGDAGDDHAEEADAETVTAADETAAAETTDAAVDTLARVVGIAGLAVGVAGLVVAIVARRGSKA